MLANPPGLTTIRFLIEDVSVMNLPADSTTDFDERYRVVSDPAMRRVERLVIGCDYGATSYTTRAQADRLARLLRLGPGKMLLDVGSGAGWPGIYLGRSTQCSVVLADQPIEGLREASRRMQHEEVRGGVVGGSGGSLPLQDRVFDAVTSSDALC